MTDSSHDRRSITRDMFEDSHEAGKRRFRSLDGANTYSAAWLGAKGVTYVADWINDPVAATGIAAGTKVWAQFTAPADKWLLIQADMVYTDSPSLVLSVFNDFTATQGAAITKLPLKAGQPNVDNIPTGSTFNVVTGTPTINAASRVATVGLFSAASGNTGGTAGGNSFVRLLPPNSPFLVELHNRNNVTHYAQFQIVWSEIPSEYLPKVGVVGNGV